MSTYKTPLGDDVTNILRETGTGPSAGGDEAEHLSVLNENGVTKLPRILHRRSPAIPGFRHRDSDRSKCIDGCHGRTALVGETYAAHPLIAPVTALAAFTGDEVQIKRDATLHAP